MRDTDRLVELFKQNGFTLARHHKHMVWRCPCGHVQMATHKTGGKGRGHSNAESQIKRESRICKANLEEKTP